ncbi:MAG: alpha/beta hydrolase [Planctomycetaceae bacterium]
MPRMLPLGVTTRIFGILVALGGALTAAEPVAIWPDLAPGETSLETGTDLPRREGENPPITRTVSVRRPTMDIFLAEKPNRTGVLVMPGGGFSRVVPDLEGSEAAPWLNELGISVFVLRYRTSEGKPEDEPAWKRPLQDGQRALRVLRVRASEWKLDPNRIGVLGFSAGGQVSSILHTADGVAAYKSIDATDEQSCRPDFSMLVYPWRVVDQETGALLKEIRITEKTPPAFLVHTHDDASTSVGAALIYIGLKQNKVPAELHIYQTGGHGYGTRHRPNSVIGTWPDRATDWLILNGWGTASDK